jgi:hypothetical protein
MSDISFKTRLKNLSLSNKILAFASISLMISTLLPWYSDIDKYKIGDSFLGITGPLYLAGFIVFIAGALSFTLVAFNFLNKKMLKLPLSEVQSHFSSAAISVVMLILAASVYFHPKFGINITEKSGGIGMFLAFISSGILVLGAFLERKSSAKSSLKKSSHMESMIEMGLEERPKGEVRQEPAPYSAKIPIRPSQRMTPMQQSIPPSYFSKSAFENKEKIDTNEIQ